MKILIISKYPPIEGGVSAKTYWTAKALGKKGHEVFIATNAWEVEEKYREQIEKDDLKNFEPENVKVFSTNSEFVPPIPFSKYYEARLTSLALDVARKYDVNIIYSHYLLPYGLSALLLKKTLNKPWVLRHAGSDITRLYSYPQLKTIFTEILDNADRIIEYANTRNIISKYNVDLNKLVRIGQAINLEEFNPKINPMEINSLISNNEKSIKNNTKIFSYFGKTSKLKKTYEFVNAASKIKDKDFIILFVVGTGNNVEQLKEHAQNLGIADKCIFLPFQAPWIVPKIMKASDCIVCPESYEEPFLPKGTHGPQIAQEAMACGKCAIIGKGVAEKGVYTKLQNKENILVVDPTNENEFANELSFVIENKDKIENIGKNARKFMELNNDYDNAIDSLIRVFNSLL